MRKNIFIRFFLIIAVFLLSLDCSSSKKNKTVVSSDDLTVTTFAEMNNGIYIGGGMLYNSTKSQYNHFDDLNTVSVRLSSLKNVELAGDVTSTTYDPATGEQLTQTTKTSMGKTEEIASSVLVGQIGIKSISDSGITFACKLIDVNGDTAVSIDNATVETGNGYDLNGDGFNDIEYLDYDTENVNGMSGTKILVFDSDADALKVTMYKSPTDSTYKFPSGIITVTPSNNVMVKMSNLSLDSSSTLSMNGSTYQCFSFQNSGLPTLTQYDYIYDDTNAKMYVINEAPTVESSTTKYYCVEYDTFAAYEYANVNFSGTTDPLSSKNIKLNISGESKLNALEKATVSLPIPEWSHTFFNDASGNLSAGIANDLSLSINADFNRSGTSVSLNSSIMFNGSSSFSLNGKITGTYSKSYSETINVVTVPVVVAGIPIGTIVVPMTYGINTSVGGYGNLAINAGISGQFGFTNSIGLGLTYRTYTIGAGRWKKKFSVPNGIDFWVNVDRTNSIDSNKSINLDFRGTAQFTPFVKMGVGFRLFGIAGFTTNATMSLTSSFTSDINYADTGSLAVQSKIVGDVSIGEDICAEISLLYWSKSITKTLAEASIWNKTFLNETLYLSSATIPYKVTYYNSGAISGTAPASSYFLQGSAATVSSNTGNLIKPSYSLFGWNPSSSLTGQTYQPGSSFSMPASDVSLYPVWAIIPNYTVTYNGNGNDAGLVPSAATYAENQSVTVSDNTGSLNRNLYAFDGWNTDKNGTVAQYKAGDVFNITSNITLYAMWKKLTTYKITYLSNGATLGSVPSVSEYVLNGNATISGNTGGLVNGTSSFNGWNTQSGGSGTSYNAGDTFKMPDANIDLYAQWTAETKYSVTYNGNGAATGDAPGQPSVALNTGITVKGQNTLSWMNHSFTGWNTLADGSGTSYSENATLTVTGNITLYAQWKALVYTVTYQSVLDPGYYTDVTIINPSDSGTYVSGDVVTIKPWSIWWQDPTTGGPTSQLYQVVIGWQIWGKGTVYSYGQSFVVGTDDVVLLPVWWDWVSYKDAALYDFAE